MLEQKSGTVGTADIQAVARRDIQPSIIVCRDAGGPFDPHRFGQVHEFEVVASQACQSISGSNPQLPVRSLSKRSHNSRLADSCEPHAIVLIQPASSSDPQKSFTILQQAADFRVFQAIVVTVVLKPIALSLK